MEYRIIDADSHVNSTPDLYVSRVPAQYRERAPRVVQMQGYDAWVIDNGKPSPITILAAAAGRRPEELARKVIRFAEMMPGAYEPKARLLDMDRDGIDAQVLYGDGAMGARDPELRTVLIRAYNDWLAEFCAAAPDRFIGQAIVPIHDPQQAVREAERTAAMAGLRGLFVGLDGADFPLTDPAYDRFWAAAAEQGRPVSIHIGGGSMVKRGALSLASPAPGLLEAYVCLTPMTISETIAMLIYSGTLSRHPRLKVVVAEGGIGWLAYFLERMDHVMEKQGAWAGTKLTEKPSDVFHRQVLATFEEDLAGIRTYDLIGPNNIMWSSDFPHSDTTWPNSRLAIEQHFSQLPEADRRAMVCENAGRIYGLIAG
jgi:predicted TIM-barrel fold metal-dependent hydrolase